MRAVVQRVTSADVTVDGKITGEIKNGLMVLIGVENEDDDSDASYIAKKVANLRIFDDENGVMNNSVIDIKGDILAVSQFTLLGDVRKGNRPSYTAAAKPEIANDIYRTVIDKLKKEHGVHVEEGVFQTEMLVRINNHGPVTIIIDSKKAF